MVGIKSMVNMNALRQVFDDFVQEQEDKTFKYLIYQGEDFVNNARDNGRYKDRTGNLRSSIGYMILKDGNVMHLNFQKSDKGSDRETGLQRAKQYANEIAALYPRGWVLIGVAGMNYAAAVESRGFDVITEASNNIDLKQFFNEVGV